MPPKRATGTSSDNSSHGMAERERRGGRDAQEEEEGVSSGQDEAQGGDGGRLGQVEADTTKAEGNDNDVAASHSGAAAGGASAAASNGSIDDEEVSAQHNTGSIGEISEGVSQDMEAVNSEAAAAASSDNAVRTKASAPFRGNQGEDGDGDTIGGGGEAGDEALIPSGFAPQRRRSSSSLMHSVPSLPGAYHVIPLDGLERQSSEDARALGFGIDNDAPSPQRRASLTNASQSNLSASGHSSSVPTHLTSTDTLGGVSEMTPPLPAIPVAIPLRESATTSVEAVVNSAAVPPSAMSITSQLRSKDTILNRRDLVDEVVRALQQNMSTQMAQADQFDESQNAVILRGVGGAGKSVLCSMVVSNQNTLRHFADGIAWLSLSQVRGESSASMSYDTYLEYLDSICLQLGLDFPTCHEPIILPSDSETVRRRKIRRAMEDAKLGMCRLLARTNVLIVLDDVWSRSAVSWLSFSNRPNSNLKTLVTTRLRGGFSKAQMIDVGTLDVGEAVKLLLLESARDCSELSQNERLLAQQVAERCGLLPVALCMAGRLISTGHNFTQDLEKFISVHGIDDPEGKSTIFSLTDRCFTDTGEATDVVKMAFVAFASLFTFNEERRAPVPAKTAVDFFDLLLLDSDEVKLAASGINGPRSLLSYLHDIGLLERRGQSYRVQHDLHQEYAFHILNDKRERRALFQKRIRATVGKSRAKKSTSDSKCLIKAIHCILGITYGINDSHAQPETYWAGLDDDGYCFSRLIRHVIASGTLKSAKIILRSASFAKKRKDSLGLIPAIRAYIEDFEALGSISHTKKEKATDQDAIGETVEILSDFIDDEAVDPSTSAKAYVMLALYFQHHFQFSESMGMLSKALATLHRKGKGGNDPEVSRIREYADNISLVPIALVPKSSKSVNIIRFARIPELLAQQEKTALIQSGRGVSATNSFDDDHIKLELSSHPGQAICFDEGSQTYLGFKSRRLVVGTVESAISVVYDAKARRFVVPGGPLAYMYCGPSHGNEGDLLYVGIPSPIISSVLPVTYTRNNNSDLIVNEDGTMSPRASPDIVLAAKTTPQIVLVKRDSPCRLILKHGDGLQRNLAPSASHDTAVEGTNVFPSDLASHPGRALVCDSEQRGGHLVGCVLNLDSATSSDAVRLIFDGKKIGAVVDKDGEFHCKYNFTMALGSNYGKNALPFVVRDTKRKMFKKESAFGLYWILNSDGSISPLYAPDRALGVHCLGGAELAVSPEQRALARSEAKLTRKDGRAEKFKRGFLFLWLVM